MKYYLKLLRPKDWAKNLFLFIPSFFSGQFFVPSLLPDIMAGFVAFCFFASAIYIINDYRDIEEDRKHPVKFARPLASGKVKKPAAIVICVVLLVAGMLLGSGRSMVCSAAVNPDLFEATCGGMGLTGIISRVKFQLKKIETSFIRQKQIKAANLEELVGLFDQYNHYTYSVAWIDCLKKGKDFGRSILMLGEHAVLADLNEKQKSRPLQLPQKKQINFPFNLPSWVLNTFTVKAFNFLFYSKNFKKEINNVIGYEPFFYPLDAILHWNRGYGKKGFIQYQFVIPLEAKNGLIDILNKISEKGLGSFLAVLKVFGRQESMISFPREGYTLALDFPVRPGLLEFLDELDQIVLEHGGRLYMSKDARMKPEIMEKGYPELAKFKDIISKYNPGGKIHSIQSDRLFLTTN